MNRQITVMLAAVLTIALISGSVWAFKVGQFQLGGGLYIGVSKFSRELDADLPIAPGVELIFKGEWIGNPLKHLFSLKAEIGLGVTKTKKDAEVKNFIENTYIPLHATIYATIFPRAKVHPYLGFGGGLLAWNIKTDETILNQTNFNITTHFALGADYYVSSHLLLDLGIKFHFILGDLRQFNTDNLEPIFIRNGWYVQFGLGAAIF